MDVTEALKLAQNHLVGCQMENHTVFHSGIDCEREFGFYFTTAYPPLKDQQCENLESLCKPVYESCSVIVERATGEVHWLGPSSGRDADYWFEVCQRGLHNPVTLVVLKVFNRRRAAAALLRLQMSSVIPEEAYGVTWVIPQLYSLKDFYRSFSDLPARYENQNLKYRLHEIQQIELEQDAEIEIELAI